MRRELEVKILDVDREKLLPRIFELWGRLDFEKEFTAIWMLCGETSKKVRIRLEWDKVAVEQKIAKENSNPNFKEAEEIGYIANNFEEQILFFETLWFKQISKSVKIRISYIINNSEFWKIKIEFDKYSDLDWISIPELLEIEGESEEKILKIAKELGFSENDLKNYWATKLLEIYKK